MLATGTVAEARAHHEQAHAIAISIGSRPEGAHAFDGIGQCLLREGDWGTAAALLRKAQAIYDDIGSRNPGRAR